MLGVTSYWTSAIREQFRYPGYLKIKMEVTPPGLREGMSVTSEDSFEKSADPNALKSRKNTTPIRRATFEKNRWLLPDKNYYSWYTTAVKSTDWVSKIIKSLGVSLLFEFGNTYDIPGVFIQWDELNGTFPEHIKIRGYSASGALINEYDVLDIDSYEGYIETPFDAVKQVEIEILKWSRQGWRARVDEIVFGLTAMYDSINNGRIVSAVSTHSVSPLGERLPVNDLSVKLRNLDGEFDPNLSKGISKYLARRQKVIYQWGFETSRSVIEWTPAVTGFVDSFSIPPDSQNVDIKVAHRLSFLTQTYRKDVYTGERRTLYDVMLSILQNSNMLEDPEVPEPWSILYSLQNFYTTAPVPREPVNSLLQLIAGASNVMLVAASYNSSISTVSWDTKSTYIQQYVTMMQQLGDPEILFQDMLYTLSIGVYKYVAESTRTIVAEGEYSIQGVVTLEIDYSVLAAKDVQCSVTGATVIGFTPYGTSATVVLQSASVVNAKVTLTGYEVKSSVTYIRTYKSSEITQGLEVVIDNPFITEEDSLQTLTDWFLYWYSRTKTYVMPYIGYPETEPADAISISTRYDTDRRVMVTSNKIVFNGAFTGTMEVK